MGVNIWPFIVIGVIVVLLFIWYVVRPQVIEISIGAIMDRYNKSVSRCRAGTQKSVGVWQRYTISLGEKIEPGSPEYHKQDYAFRSSELLAAYSADGGEMYAYRHTLRLLGNPLLGKKGDIAVERLCVNRLTEIYDRVSRLEEQGLSESFDKEFRGVVKQKLPVSSAAEIELVVRGAIKGVVGNKASRFVAAGTSFS